MARRPLSFFRDRVIEDRLGSYVYMLRDPRNGKVFYVGKAGGHDGQGNTRPDRHLNETDKALKSRKRLSEKQQIINEIWKKNRDPVLAIVRRQLDSSGIAFEVEAALIEVLQLLKQAEGNKVSGHDSERGLLIGPEIDVVGARPVNPKHEIDDVWLFNISKTVGRGKDPCDAVRGNWAIGMPDSTGFAVGLVRGVSRVVCRIDRWLESEKRRSGRITRKYFKGRQLDIHSEIGGELLYRDFAKITSACGAWQLGRPVCVRFDGRGSADPTYNRPKGLKQKIRL